MRNESYRLADDQRMYHTMSSMRDQCFTITYFVCQMYLRQYRTDDEDRVEGEREDIQWLVITF